MAIKIKDIAAYAHGTKSYVIDKNKIVVGVVVKREINEFDFVNYGLKVPERKTPIWVNEDQITDDVNVVFEKLKKNLITIKQ
jgi:hypothetical protein